MTEFFNSLSILEIILFVLAASASIILIIQIILMLVGFSGGDASDIGTDTDTFDGSDNVDSGAGGDLALFTVKGIVAFFAVGGWVGFAMSTSGIHIAWVITGAFLSGAAALVGIAYLIKLGLKLQSNGMIVYKNAIGSYATVYLTIPSKGNGKGKINLTVQERFIEAEAITNSDEKIITGSQVKITDYINDTYIVEKI